MADLGTGNEPAQAKVSALRGSSLGWSHFGRPDPDRVAWLDQARSHLRDADPVLAGIIDDRPDFDPRKWMARLPPMDLYGTLLFQITGQQLSVAATRRALARIQALFGGHLPSPAELLAVDPPSSAKPVCLGGK